MKQVASSVLVLFLAFAPGLAQDTANVADFSLALPAHPGRLQWHADGFKVVESSAKPNGQEIGIRGQDTSGRITFLGFLFLVPEESPLTSAKCRDGVVEPIKKSAPTLKVTTNAQIPGSGGLTVELVSFSGQGRDGKAFNSLRGFIATGDTCGDLEFYSSTPIRSDDPTISAIFQSYRLNPTYVPQFRDIFLYAQILYNSGQFKAAAPMFEQALAKVPTNDPDRVSMRRVLTDQAGMAYGVSGNIPRARAIFTAAISTDPDYPMYYYNLACADAEENKLADARAHLQQAFARKANMVRGETIPDPTKDDSFLPYRNNKDFWTFLQGLR